MILPESSTSGSLRTRSPFRGRGSTPWELELSTSLDWPTFVLSIYLFRFGCLPDRLRFHTATLRQYDAFIDEIAKNDITPVLTIFHWDAPLALLLKYGAWQDIGDSIVNDYVAYATTVFKRYGQKVKHYVTFNEPREPSPLPFLPLK